MKSSLSSGNRNEQYNSSDVVRGAWLGDLDRELPSQVGYVCKEQIKKPKELVSESHPLTWS
jgi:hypothetical protein